ncbi:MAG: aminotransferase class III-fold pyridoxal phosphate-dependent enzyme, partial [Halanaerobiales bacterium]
MKNDLLNIEEALSLSQAEIRQLYKEHVNPGLANMLSILNFDRKFVRAKGTKVWDADGNEYIDFLGGYGSLNLGHNPDVVLEAVKRVMELPNI